MLLLKGGHVVSPADKLDGIFDILIEDGKIAAIGENLTTGGEVLELSGKLVFPGFIDMHVHLRDPGLTHKEDIFTGCAAAAAGGITGVACMPNTNPVTDSPEVIRYIKEKAQNAKAKIYPVACITKGMAGGGLTDMSALQVAGAVGVSDDGKPVKNAMEMLDGMRKAKENQLLPISHCEDMDIIGKGLMHEGIVSQALGVPGMHRASEDSITAREIALAESENLPIHIAHVSTTGAIGQIRDAKARGVQVTCETCPHYFILTHEKLRAKDADFRMNPPLRDQSDVSAILAAIVDGTVDCIVTDHAPHAAPEKQDFLTAPNGVVGLETSFAASYTYLVKSGKIPLSQLVALMSVNPAKLLGVPGGSLTVGAPADIAIADPHRVWTVEPNKLHSKSHNTVFKGMTFTGKVICTLLNGEPVYTEI